MESLEKQLKASHEAKSRLAKEKKSIADKATRTEGKLGVPGTSELTNPANMNGAKE